MSEWISETQKAIFWSKVNPTDYCWQWGASLNTHGYGTCNLGIGETLAHRIAYQIINGRLNKRTQVLHKCDNPRCVNPSHLFTGTHLDNMRDKESKGRQRMVGRSSKFHGVGWRNDSKTWRAYYTKDKKLVHIGCFSNEFDAALAHDAKSIEMGIFNKLNFPTKTPSSETDSGPHECPNCNWQCTCTSHPCSCCDEKSNSRMNNQFARDHAGQPENK